MDQEPSSKKLQLVLATVVAGIVLAGFIVFLGDGSQGHRVNSLKPGDANNENHTQDDTDTELNQTAAFTEAYILENIAFTDSGLAKVRQFEFSTQLVAVEYAYDDISSFSDYQAIVDGIVKFLEADGYVWTHRSPDSPLSEQTFTDVYQKGEHFFELLLTPSKESPRVEFTFTVGN